jgi:hypothetical protein
LRRKLRACDIKVSSNQDQARLIAERVARRVTGAEAQLPAPSASNNQAVKAPTRARMIDFVSTTPPAVIRPSISATTSEPQTEIPTSKTVYAPATQSPWLAPFAGSLGSSSAADRNSQSAILNSPLPNHPSQERFGVDEAVVSELVEFFEAEKQCSVDPSGKPCDHCAMCSSRGF